jgi:hypothetical protein
MPKKEFAEGEGGQVEEGGGGRKKSYGSKTPMVSSFCLVSANLLPQKIRQHAQNSELETLGKTGEKSAITTQWYKHRLNKTHSVCVCGGSKWVDRYYATI